MKGIVLAGGHGTRLYPTTQAVSKHLLPVHDKPMIYYPLSVLMLAGIRDILLITMPRDQEAFKRLLGGGENLGINIQYKTQSHPKGIAEAFTIGEEFIGTDDVALILGDNIFYGRGFRGMLERAIDDLEGATIFGYSVRDPERFGIVEVDERNKAVSIEEKPENPKSNIAVTGFYLYNNEVIDISKRISPSSRGELEITSVNKRYMRKGKLKVEELGRGHAWLDAGTPKAMGQATEFVRAVEERQGLKIACVEEVAWRQGWVTAEDLRDRIEDKGKSKYARYIEDIITNGK